MIVVVITGPSLAEITIGRAIAVSLLAVDSIPRVSIWISSTKCSTQVADKDDDARWREARRLTGRSRRDQRATVGCRCEGEFGTAAQRTDFCENCRTSGGGLSP